MTDSARRRRIDDICDAALDLPASDRQAFVVAACGDDHALRTEVEGLLSHAAHSDGFLEESLGEVAAQVIDGREALAAGRRLGPYEIVALIGAGGMGEVYRARDTKLGRDVAIKVIARAAPADNDQMARFEREARILAALNHPHIGAIYGLEDVDGIRALILELVEGKTLAERLAETRPSVPAALTIARDIAAAVEAAHEKGVIHRDLKPANIKITPEGAVKVLDFGLAKVFASDDGAAGPASSGLTFEDKEGVIAGTAGYMSPEQARGAPVNKRTDVWAFGCVLYEMLAGRPAFSGDTRADITAWILERDPDWSALPAGTPTVVRRLLQRCLERDAGRRLRDLGDARLEIEEAISGVGQSGADLQPGRSVARKRRPILWWAAGAAILVGATAATTTWYTTSSLPQEQTEPSWQDPIEGAKFTPLTDWEGGEQHAAISPKGEWVVFISDRETRGTWDAWVRPIGTRYNFRKLTNIKLRELRNPATRTIGFMLNGSDVLLWSRKHDPKQDTDATQSGGLVDAGQTVSIIGGPLQPYSKMADRISELDFSRDGKWVVYHPPTDGDPMYVTEVGNTATVAPIHGTKPGWHNHFLKFSPDAELIYFVHGLPAEKSDVWRIRRSGGSLERITAHDSTVSFPVFLDSRTMLYLATDEDGYGPWIYAMDVERRVPHRISRGLQEYTSLDASADGLLLVATESTTTSQLRSLPITNGTVDASGVSQIIPLPTTNGASPRFGPGFFTYRAPARAGGGLDGIWKVPGAGGDPTELWNGLDGRPVSGAVVSRDGKRVAFVVRKDRKSRLYVVNVDGTDARPISGDLEILGAPAWSQEGQWVLAGTIRGEQVNLVKFHVDKDIQEVLVNDYAVDPAVSPSGEFVVYTGADIGTNFVLRAVNADGTKKDVPEIKLTRGARRMAFRSEHELVVMNGNISYRDFELVNLVTGITRLLSKLTPSFEIQDFDISRDGRSIIFDSWHEESNIVLIDRRKR